MHKYIFRYVLLKFFIKTGNLGKVYKLIRITVY